MRIVKGAQTANRVLYEMTVAHELTHALEDQRFGFELDRLAAGDDAALAYTALVEGTATAMMYRYVERRFGAEETFGGLAASAFQPTGDLPPFLMAQLLFPYTAGEAFVSRLLELGRGDWTVVDAALRVRPPVSTEQVMHPQAYLEGDEPRARLARAGRCRSWGRAGARCAARARRMGDREVLARAGGTASGEAAAGWGGDRAVLLGRGDDRALVARWTWDTPADADEFARRAPRVGRRGAAGLDRGRARRLAHAVRRRCGAPAGDAVTLVLAPDVGARPPRRAH